jgi:hypothetical protein
VVRLANHAKPEQFKYLDSPGFGASTGNLDTYGRLNLGNNGVQHGQLIIKNLSPSPTMETPCLSASG